MKWLDQNPMVEFQAIDKVLSPAQIGRNPRFLALVPAAQIDLSGRIALPQGRENPALGPAEVLDLFSGADISPGGRTLFAMPSRNAGGSPTIRLNIQQRYNRFDYRESVNTVVTEYGVAHLKGLSLRERAQALIDLAHPDDRSQLIEQAKARHILYPDQIFLAAGARLYPDDIAHSHTFKNNTTIYFRGIKPSDEEEMRRLFYRFSNDAVYSRYFGHIAAMPHSRMQAYVNVDWRQTFSIAGIAGRPDQERVVAEARFIRLAEGPAAEVVFVVDEAYQGLGLATYLYRLLIAAAFKRGIRLFVADVLFSNTAMMKVFRKGGLPLKARLDSGVYHLEIPIDRRTGEPRGCPPMLPVRQT
jgi:RimJ/RimL family protein N-acetyltransferase